jgi:hypothetical protein
MLDDATASPSPDQVSSSESRRHFRPWGEISEGNRRTDPAVNPQYRAPGHQKQHFVNRHVLRGRSWTLFLDQMQLIKLHTRNCGWRIAVRSILAFSKFRNPKSAIGNF